MKKRTVVVAYIPVLHKGYLDFLNTCIGADELYVIGPEFAAEFSDVEYIGRKDAIRALPADLIADAISISQSVFRSCRVLDHRLANVLQQEDVRIILLDEDITRAVAQKYFQNNETEFRSAFVRWHRDNVEEQKAVAVHRSIPVSDFDQEMMSRAFVESSKSADWWRQVGGVLVQDGSPIIIAHNQHVPDEQMPYSFGDPRSIFKRGIHLELSTAEHAESVLIGEAAARGISTHGAWLYVTTFPCPPCAKLVSRAGVSRCYFSEGYAVLDGEQIMKSKKMELVFVER